MQTFFFFETSSSKSTESNEAFKGTADLLPEIRSDLVESACACWPPSQPVFISLGSRMAGSKTCGPLER